MASYPSGRSQNASVNSGAVKGGSPKDTSSGADTSLHATNVITVCGVKGTPYSPSANSQSRNK